MASTFVPGFDVRRHGFPFPNSFPAGTPVVSIGPIRLGNAGIGLCGGMVYAAADLFLFDRPVPSEPTEPVVRYFCRRLLDSFGFPFGWLKYWDWQARADVTELTARDWPRAKATLDAGMLCPLGVVKIRSRDPRELGRNHQVLAFGYEWNGDRMLTLHTYDPNWPGEPVELQTRLGEPVRPVRHSLEGESVRGFFPTAFERPADPPVFAGPGP